MKKGLFDSYIAAALEYDIFAGGDPERPKADRYTTPEASVEDATAVAQKTAIDNGEMDPSPQAQANPDTATGNEPQEDPNMMGDAAGGDPMADPAADDSMGGEMGEGGEDQFNTPMGGDTPSEGDAANMPPDPQDQLNKKRNIVLFQMVTSLHNGISSNLDMMNQMEPPVNSEKNDIFFQVQKQLEYCKNLLYDIATKEIGTGDYVDILRRVTTIDKIYDLCSDVMEKLYPKETNYVDRHM